MGDLMHTRYANWLSLAGSALTTVGAVLFLVFFGLDLAGFHTNPYFGIVTFLFLPAVFLTGLLLIPLGFWRARRRVARGKAPRLWPTLDFSREGVRRGAIAILALTAVNVAIVSMAAYKSVEYSESTGFCTGVCHTPMEPEAVSHKTTVHANISCSSCHVSPGAPGFVSAKMGGVRRLAAVASGMVARPIPSPVHDLPGASGTCVTCHVPGRFVGERTRQIHYYSDDEEVSEQITTLILNVGGGGDERGGPHGIHWHASPHTRVEYIADERRETIPWVRVTDLRGTREYATASATPEQIASAPKRTMDCTDCHNRAGHVTAATVDRAVDLSLARGLLPRSLPYIRREAIAAASPAYPDRATAERQIAEHLRRFYTQQSVLAGDARLAQAVAATQRLWTASVFPAMNVTWGTYPSQIGHTDAPGCFRCHDEEHKSRTGGVIGQDCESCHRMP